MFMRRFAHFLSTCCIALITLTACDLFPTPTSPPPPPSGGNSGNTGSTQPDLHIIGADLQKEDLDEGIYTVNVLMENLGADTSDTFFYGCYWECASSVGTTHLVENRIENGLSASQGTTIGTIRGFDIACEPLPSTLTFNCEIDTQSDIDEANENNNSWSGSLGVPIVP